MENLRKAIFVDSHTLGNCAHCETEVESTIGCRYYNGQLVHYNCYYEFVAEENRKDREALEARNVLFEG